MRSTAFGSWRVWVVCAVLGIFGSAAQVTAAVDESTPDLSQLGDKELKSELRKIFVRDHRVKLDYGTARSLVVGELHVEHGESGSYIHDVYCQLDYPYKGKSNRDEALRAIANYGTVNVEHTWPQSRFKGGSDRGAQKSDLHHLFPADKELNNIRANHRFGDVDDPIRNLRCPESRLGDSPAGPIFEPPDSHKGNVARALFYFSIRYGLPISSDEEKALKAWNHQDPVDAAEFERNDKIESIQGNRNLFIDHPEFADRIADF